MRRLNRAKRSRPYRNCGWRTAHHWAFLQVPVSTAAFEPDCSAVSCDLFPFFATAFYILSVDHPELFGFYACQRSETFCSRGEPHDVDYETCPRGRRYYPQVGNEYFHHVFHHMYLCSARIQYVRNETYIIIEYAILRYKRFGPSIIKTSETRTVEERPSSRQCNHNNGTSTTRVLQNQRRTWP